MRNHVVAVLLSLVAVSFVADAQVPRITPRGDPSVNADTIYKLAVDPRDYPQQVAALLLDDGVVVVEADGRMRRTYRTVVQILKPEAEENYQERTFSYAPGHERLTVNWIRVVKPSGEVISDGPSHVQDSDVPASEGDPVYSDRKVRRVSLTGVKAGAIVDYSYTTEELKPFLAGDFFLTWSVNPGVPVRRSRYVVDVPASMTPRIVEHNLDFPRRTSEASGRRTYVWARADVPIVRPEELAADSNSVYMSIYVSAPISWETIGRWYAGNAKDRYQLGPRAEAAARDALRGARTLGDSIRALHRWVAQDIRYVSIALGLGGYQPRTPDEVVRTGFGDCKDKATLFIAALAKIGVTAYPVILNSTGVSERGLPSIDQLNHAIAAVRLGDTLTYADLTADVVPFGEVPGSYQGELGLVVHPDGRTEEITFPKAKPERNLATIRIEGALSESGEFNGSYVEEDFGARAVALREGFRHPLDSTTKANAATGIARKYFEYAKGDSLDGFNGLDLGAPTKFRVLIRNGKAAEKLGDSYALRLPFPPASAMNNAAVELEEGPPRRFAIDPEKFFGNVESRSEFRLTLPAGWRAKLPASVHAKSAFGTYDSEYAQDGNVLVIRRRIAGATGVQPPEAVRDLIAWLRAMGKDDTRMIVLEPTAALQAAKP